MVRKTLTAEMPQSTRASKTSTVRLPAPCQDGTMSLEMCLRRRRSIRTFTDQPLSTPELAQLLWAAQGITGVPGLRTAPSARALYPLRLDVVATAVDGLTPGVYRFDPEAHELKLKATGDVTEELVAACGGQEIAGFAAVVIALSANFTSMRREFGEQAPRLTYLEAGHVAQNVCLQVVALGLGAVPVGALDVGALKRILRLATPEETVYLLAVGAR